MVIAKQKPNRRRRWLRYNLCTLFVFLTLTCVWLSLLVHRVGKQRKAVAWVVEMGGTVYYDYEVEDEKPPGPGWLRNLIGVDYFSTVEAVRLTDISFDDVTPLVKLKSLRFLDLSRTDVTDLTPLSKLTSLEMLILNSTGVSDVTPLSNLTDLDELFLNRTHVSEEDYKSLQRALPDCEIKWWSWSEMVQLECGEPVSRPTPHPLRESP